MKVDAYEIFIYNADVSYLPSLFEINLNQMTINSLVFRLTDWTKIASALAISEERGNLHCPMTSRKKRQSCLVIQLILSSKVRF